MKLFKMLSNSKSNNIESDPVIKREGVMIVDDSRFSRNVLRDILVSEGFEVVGEASDGLEAVQMAKEIRPEYIFLDVEMPKLDGLGALPRLLENDPGVNVIMCTALGQKKIIIEATKAGAKDYVIKPYKKENITDLLDVIKEDEKDSGNVIPFHSESDSKAYEEKQKKKAEAKYKPVQEYNKPKKEEIPVVGKEKTLDPARQEEPLTPVGYDYGSQANVNDLSEKNLGTIDKDEDKLPVGDKTESHNQEPDIMEKEILKELEDSLKAEFEEEVLDLEPEEKDESEKEMVKEIEETLKTEIEDSFNLDDDESRDIERFLEGILEEVLEDEPVQAETAEEELMEEEIEELVESEVEEEELVESEVEEEVAATTSYVYLWTDRFSMDKDTGLGRRNTVVNRSSFSYEDEEEDTGPGSSALEMLGQTNSERLMKFGMMSAYMEKGYQRINTSRATPSIKRPIEIPEGRSFVENVLHERHSKIEFSIADMVSNVDINSIMLKKETMSGIYSAMADMVAEKGNRKLYVD